MLRALFVIYFAGWLVLALIDGHLHKRLKRDATWKDGGDRAAQREENWYGSRAGNRQRRGSSGGSSGHPHRFFQLAHKPVRYLPLATALDYSEDQTPVACLVGPENVGFSLIEQRDGSCCGVMQAQIPPGDHRPGSLLCFVYARDYAVGIFLFEYDGHLTLELFAEFSPQVLIKIIWHLLNENLVNRP
jgi:hypothetical protein